MEVTTEIVSHASHGVDVSQFGVGTMRSINQFYVAVNANWQLGRVSLPVTVIIRPGKAQAS